MSTLQFENLYHVRKVAESSAKSCFVCYKPSTTVMVASDGKSDFFYVCPSHLTDVNFAQPQEEPVKPSEALEKEELDKEIEAMKQKWAERQKAKTEGDKEDKKDKKDAEPEPSFFSRMFKGSEKKEKSSENSKTSTPNSTSSVAPRIFILNKDIYSLRVQTHRTAKRAKQHQRMVNKPNLFPSVPTNKLE